MGTGAAVSLFSSDAFVEFLSRFGGWHTPRLVCSYFERDGWARPVMNKKNGEGIYIYSDGGEWRAQGKKEDSNARRSKVEVWVEGVGGWNRWNCSQLQRVGK